MKFVSAMTAVAAGHVARRPTWAPTVGIFASVTHVAIDVVNGAPVTSSPVIRRDAAHTTDAIYYANAEDQAAEDWEVIAQEAPVEQEADASNTQLPLDDDGSVPAPLDPCSPTAQTDTQPEDAGNPPAAPLSDQSPVQDPIGFDANGSPPADEATTPVQEVVEDSGAPAAANGV